MQTRQFARTQFGTWLGRLALAIAAVGFVAVGVAEARVGSGSSSGSRGTKSFTPPPATNTAPSAAKPLERSATQPGTAATTAGASNTAASAATGSRFGGFGKMLAGGLIGAALIGMLGMSGGLAGVLGFILQAAVIGGLIYLAVAFFRRRSAPATTPALASSTAGRPTNLAREQNIPYGKPTPAGGSGKGPAATPALNLGESDFTAFEKLLGEVQNAYGREDLATLRSMATAEMAGYLADDLAANAKKGVRNEVSDAKLLQGDLSEAWSEGDEDYATVAMRYSIIDATIDRASGKVVSGDRTRPDEVTEVWTFVRPRGASLNAWKLSAIQQT